MVDDVAKDLLELADGTHRVERELPVEQGRRRRHGPSGIHRVRFLRDGCNAGHRLGRRPIKVRGFSIDRCSRLGVDLLSGDIRANDEPAGSSIDVLRNG